MPLQRGPASGCRVCHAPLSVKFGNVARAPGVCGGGRGKGKGGDDDDDDELESLLKKLRKKNLDQFKQLGLIIGKPLPQKGACRHFAHSYRWLRFPCCGRAYPCAACHEASDCPAAALGVWASRMLCGKCSREMPYSDQPCAHCGNTFCKPVCTQCSSRPKHHTTRSVPPHQRSRLPPLDLFSLTATSSSCLAGWRSLAGWRGCRDQQRLSTKDCASSRARPLAVSRRQPRRRVSALESRARRRQPSRSWTSRDGLVARLSPCSSCNLTVLEECASQQSLCWVAVVS